MSGEAVKIKYVGVGIHILCLRTITVAMDSMKLRIIMANTVYCISGLQFYVNAAYTNYY